MTNDPIQVVMVGDCAWVGETLIHYAPTSVNYRHLTRTRSIYSKTLGIMIKILSSMGDVYHVHYGLQDHFMTKLLKRKPTICHLHGSDLRKTISSRFGWIVKNNLRTANKVIVAVPDILETAKSYRSDAEYVPNPVNLDLFRPLPPRNRGKELNIFFASALSFVKGAQRFVQQFAHYQKDNPASILHVIRYGENQSEILESLNRLGIKFRLHEPMPHDEMPQLYYDSDIVVTDFQLGYLHLTSLEAMACNRPILQYVDEKLYSRLKMPLPPVVRISNADETDKGLCKLADHSTRERVCKEQLTYLHRYHDPTMISNKIAELYREVIGDKRL